jgi:hypothetical protein
LHIQVQEACRTPNRLEQNRTSSQHIIIKITTQRIEKEYWMLEERKKQITLRKSIKFTADFTMESLKARRAWSEVFWVLNENNFNPRILYPKNYQPN